MRHNGPTTGPTARTDFGRLLRPLIVLDSERTQSPTLRAQTTNAKRKDRPAYNAGHRDKTRVLDSKYFGRINNVVENVVRKRNNNDGRRVRHSDSATDVVT